MKASEARKMAEQATPVEHQLPVESYVRWVMKRVDNRVKEGKFSISPVFDGINVPANAETSVKIAEALEKDEYKVAFDEKGLITRVEW